MYRQLNRRNYKIISLIFTSCFVSSLFVVSLAFGQATGGSNKKSKNNKTSASEGKVNANYLVRKISLKGNKKIEADAVLNKLISKEGQPYLNSNLRKDVEEIFKTGYFLNVEVNEEAVTGGVELTYILTEKPSIVEIHYDGNDEVEDSDLEEQSGLKAYEVLNMSRLQDVQEKLLKYYEDKGYFLAKITYRVEDVSKGESVKVFFKIEENDKVKVKQITFLGNKQLPSGKLKSVMATQEGGFFSFISGSGAYKQEAFDRDLQGLQYFYFNEGFVQVKIDRPQVYVSPDQRSISISIRIDEGQKFDVGSVDFAGDLLFSRDELFETISIDGSKTFVFDTMQGDIRALQAKYGDLGYAFANIIPRTRVRESERLVDITYEIDKGNKVYFGKITVKGNTKTRDKVVRRELRVREGELYNETRKRESIDNVKRLGFFEDVSFNTKTPTDNPDLLDVEIVVKERNTGILTIGAGYSTYSNFVFNGRVDQINLFGRGQKLGASIDVSKRNSLFNLSFTEPYFLDTEWSLGGDVYQSKRQVDEYSETKTGGAIRIGHPLAPYLRGFVRYKLDKTQIDLNDESDPDLYPVETANGITSSVTFTLEYDKRNDRFSPTKGIYTSFSIEYAGLGGDLNYTKGNANARYYKQIFWDLVLRNNLNYAFVAANASGDEPPFNELFLLGGPNSLRGFREVGKRKFSNNAYNQLVANNDPHAYERAFRSFGGTQQLYYNLEIEFPLISEAGIKGVTFYDIGNADDRLVMSDFRSDAGFGFRWFSPIGPLRFEWGFPFQRNTVYDERSVEFNFSIGTPF